MSRKTHKSAKKAKMRSFRTIPILALTALIVYLFVTAPSPLPEEAKAEQTVPISEVLTIAAAENDIVRTLWTKEIVGKGKKAGLAFGEDWRERGVEKGPLPALFLREMAMSLEKNPVPLSVFLGSDYPISEANNFDGIQTEKFELIKQNHEPQFFYSEDTQRHTAMFADVAVAAPCVTCHNEHPQSPKIDWKLGDVMGATTWMYPEETVSMDELVEILGALRGGFTEAYTNYLEKVESFENPPEIGDKWPSEGYYLPSAEVFLNEAIQRSSRHTLNAILDINETGHESEGE